MPLWMWNFSSLDNLWHYFNENSTSRILTEKVHKAILKTITLNQTIFLFWKLRISNILLQEELKRQISSVQYTKRKDAFAHSHTKNEETSPKYEICAISAITTSMWVWILIVSNQRSEVKIFTARVGFFFQAKLLLLNSLPWK